MTRPTRPDITPAVLTSEEAAIYVGLGIEQFRAAVRAREIAVIEHRGHWRFRPEDLSAYLEHMRQPAAWERTATKRSGDKVVALPTTGINAVTRLPWNEKDKAR